MRTSELQYLLVQPPVYAGDFIGSSIEFADGTKWEGEQGSHTFEISPDGFFVDGKFVKPLPGPHFWG